MWCWACVNGCWACVCDAGHVLGVHGVGRAWCWACMVLGGVGALPHQAMLLLLLLLLCCGHVTIVVIVMALWQWPQALHHRHCHCSGA